MGSLAVKCFVDNEHQLEDDSLRDREPVKLFQNGGDRTGFSRQCHDAGCGVLEALKTGNLVVRKTVEKSIAVVKTRSNECMNDFFSGTLVQVLAYLTNIPDVK